MRRKQTEQIKKDLAKKMVFLVGPRQVGKTWLAREIGKGYAETTYLNYDSVEDRQIIKKEAWPKKTELLILDELHKMKGWKNYLKGVFDTREEKQKILVTGSARLNTFRQSGDALSGRFFVHRLLPFSLSEIKGLDLDQDSFGLGRFMLRSGFPEPFLADSEEDANRWRSQYIDGLVRSDILDFETIHNFQAIRTIFELLRQRVGSSISYSSLAEDAQISPATAKKYVHILESLYIVFRIFPHSKNIARSILREPKIYFFDNGLVLSDEGAKFENLVAISLLKHIYGKSDYTGKNYALEYLRNKEKREVDFVVSIDEKLDELIEVKLSDSNLSRSLKYFCDKYGIKGTQLVKDLKREKTFGKIDIALAEKYLKNLFL